MAGPFCLPYPYNAVMKGMRWTLKKTTVKNLAALLLYTALSGCQSGSDEGKTIASTHPMLEKQLQEDSAVRTPITSDENPALYQRYRLLMDAYGAESSYRVQEVYSGRLAPLDEASHADARKFKTVLQQGLQEGINFAGHFTVVAVGCGTSCQQHYVVDRRNGKVVDIVQSSLGAGYSSDSRLFVLNAPDPSVDYGACRDCTPKAFVLENGKLKKLAEETN